LYLPSLCNFQRTTPISHGKNGFRSNSLMAAFRTGLPGRSSERMTSQPGFVPLAMLAELRHGSLRPPLRSGRSLVGVPGVEPGTSSLSGTRSNQLSYTPFFAPLRGASKGKPCRLLPWLAMRSSRPLQRPPSEAWWRQPGLNRRPRACKARALPTELCPHHAIRCPTRTSGADGDKRNPSASSLCTRLRTRNGAACDRLARFPPVARGEHPSRELRMIVLSEEFLISDFRSPILQSAICHRKSKLPDTP
jgi:hypothetical protein